MNVDYDWTSAVVTLLLRLEVSNLKTRRAVYEAAYEVQNVYLEQHEASLAPEDVNFMRKFLRYTVMAIESDVRNGVDIGAEGYVPTELPTVARTLVAERETRLSRRVSASDRSYGSSTGKARISLTQADQASLDRVQAGLAYVDPREPLSGRSAAIASPVAVVRALLIQNFLLIASDSRVALLWTLIAPAVLLTIISLVYFITGTSFILGMDVPTFALIGCVTWVMSRHVIFRVSGSYAHHKMWIHIPIVKSLHTTLAQAMISLTTFSVVFVVLLTGGHYAGLTTLPNSVPRFVLPVIGMWLFAYGVGLVFGVVASYWSFFLRFASPIERSVQMLSSVMFVSEQLPEDWKPYVLWLPTAHGMQLIRAGYFASYSAPDASPTYFALSVACSLLAGVTAVRMGRHRIEPL